MLTFQNKTGHQHEDAANSTASRRDNTEQDEADLTGNAELGDDTGSAEIGGLAGTQADEAGPALGASRAVPQASNSLIPLPAKHLSAAVAVKKGTKTRSNSVRGRFIK